jgi:hypothetical protein
MARVQFPLAPSPSLVKVIPQFHPPAAAVFRLRGAAKRRSGATTARFNQKKI